MGTASSKKPGTHHNDTIVERILNAIGVAVVKAKRKVSIEAPYAATLVL